MKWSIVLKIKDKRYYKEVKRLKKELYEDLVIRGDAIAGRASATMRQLLEEKK